MIKLTLKHQNKNLLDACALGVSEALKGELTEERVLGPEYPSINRINNLYQKNILFKIEKQASSKMVKEIIVKWLNIYKKDASYKTVRFIIDVDPQ